MEHPGRLIWQEIDSRNLTQKQAATLLGIGQPFISDIINGRRDISVGVARRLEAAGIGSAIEWLHRQAEYDLVVAR